MCCQEFLCALRKPKINYRVRTTVTCSHSSQINPYHILTFYVFKFSEILPFRDAYIFEMHAPSHVLPLGLLLLTTESGKHTIIILQVIMAIRSCAQRKYRRGPREALFAAAWEIGLWI